MEHLTIDFLSNYVNLAIIGVCICVGYMLKSMAWIDNKYIPVIMGCLGVFLSAWVNWGHFDIGVVLAGLISGMASCGFYDAFKKMFIEGGK